MAVSSALEIFRLVAAEFESVLDADVLQWIELTEPLISKRRFGRLYHQALALLVAHRMKMANVGVPVDDDPLTDIGAVSVGNLMRVASYSEGETSVSFGNSAGQYSDADAEFALTPYGIQYLNLRKRRIIPIISAGESGGGS